MTVNSVMRFFYALNSYLDSMNNGGLKFSLELLMWIVTTILICLILLPVYINIKAYPFYLTNVIFIVVFFTFARYIFLLKHTIVARSLFFKGFMMLVSIPIIMYLLDSLSSFQGFADDIGLQTLVTDLSLSRQESMIKYIRTEMIFFGVGAIIVAILFPFRMLVSIWRGINKNTV